MNYHWSKIKVLTLLGQVGLQTQSIKENLVIFITWFCVTATSWQLVGMNSVRKLLQGMMYKQK